MKESQRHRQNHDEIRLKPPVRLAWLLFLLLTIGMLTLGLQGCSTQSITPDLNPPGPKLMIERPNGSAYLDRVLQEQKAYQEDLGSWEGRLQSLLTKLMD